METPRLVGFEELGNEDGFDTAVLELRLLHLGLCIYTSVVIHDNNDYSPGVISKTEDNSLQPLFRVSSSRTVQNDEIFDL